MNQKIVFIVKPEKTIIPRSWRKSLVTSHTIEWNETAF
jgi:hypothetical protein